MKIVLIKWVDSCHSNDWKTKSEARKECTISQCESVGFILKSNFKEITIFQNKSDTGNVTEIMSIPRGSIKSIKELGQDDRVVDYRD